MPFLIELLYYLDKSISFRSLSYRDLLQLSTTTEGQELSTPIKTEVEKDDGTDISSPISIIYKLDEFKVHQAM